MENLALARLKQAANKNKTNADNNGVHSSNLVSLTGSPGVKVSIKDRAEIDQDTMLTVQDLLDWEESNGRIPDKSVVLVHTGRGRLYEEKEKYLGRPKGLDLQGKKEGEVTFAYWINL